MLTIAQFLVLIICATLQTVAMQHEPKRLGCYVDDNKKPHLHDKSAGNETGNIMTVNYCLIYCRSFNFPYAAVNNGFFCFCGSTFRLKEKVSDSECNVGCLGDHSQPCGAYLRSYIFTTGQYNIGRIGCYKSAEIKYLIEWPEYHDVGNEASVPYCQALCRIKGFTYAVIKDSLCGCRLTNQAEEKLTDLKCRVPCKRSKFTTCGGYDAYEVYSTFTNNVRIGCYLETGQPYQMREYMKADNITTVPFCLNYCMTKGFIYTAVQNGKWCSCANSYDKNLKVGDSECNVPCKGNRLTTCGGDRENEIYQTYFYEPKRLGCFRDDADMQDLPYKKISNDEMSLAYCLAHCRSFGFLYMAVQSGSVCSCGVTFGLYGKVSDSECNYKCRGDNSATCGGLNVNEIYTIEPYQFGRLGCYKEAEVKAETELTISIWYYAGNKTSVPFCQDYCKEQKFAYTYVKGVMCGCKQSYHGYEKVSDMECTLPCEGNKLTTCGDYKRTEIYNSLPYYTGRIGCFKEASLTRQLEKPVGYGYFDGLGLPNCRSICKSENYNYTALLDLSVCSCTNDYRQFGEKLDDSACSKPCQDNVLTTCGGRDAIEIYKTSYNGGYDPNL